MKKKLRKHSTSLPHDGNQFKYTLDKYVVTFHNSSSTFEILVFTIPWKIHSQCLEVDNMYEGQLMI